jgi:hypothetical protein
MNGMLLTGDATPPALSPRPKVKIEVGPRLCAGESILLPVTSSTSLDGVIYDPLRKDEIHAQLLQLQHRRTFPIEIKAPRLRFSRGAYTFPREYFSNKRVLQLNEREPTNENLAYLNAGCVVQRGPFFYRVLG